MFQPVGDRFGVDANAAGIELLRLGRCRSRGEHCGGREGDPGQHGLASSFRAHDVGPAADDASRKTGLDAASHAATITMW